MAVTTRSTEYELLLREFHELQQVVKQYVVPRLQTLKTRLDELEPGTGGGVDQRIYNITFQGAVLDINDDPHVNTLYDDAGISLHQTIWGLDYNLNQPIADMFTGTGTGMKPVIGLIGGPIEFHTSSSSVMSLMLGSGGFTEPWQVLHDAGRSVYNLTLSSSVTALIDGNTSLDRITVGSKASTLIADGRSIADIIFTLGSDLDDVPTNLIAMIKNLEYRMGVVEGRVDALD